MPARVGRRVDLSRTWKIDLSRTSPPPRRCPRRRPVRPERGRIVLLRERTDLQHLIRRGPTKQRFARLRRKCRPGTVRARYRWHPKAFPTPALLGPITPPSVTGQPAVRWSYLKQVKAFAAFWHVVRGKRAVFDDEWPPRAGAFCSSIKRSCAHATSGQLPLLLAELRAVRIRRESALPRLLHAVA